MNNRRQLELPLDDGGNLPVRTFEPRCCADCGVDCVTTGEWYMVHDAVWKDAGMATLGGALCIDCLEERLDRDLTVSDFMDVPLNESLPHKSSRLRAALLRKNQAK
jgi:hypothetical protein